jgi:hypothetical protein
VIKAIVVRFRLLLLIIYYLAIVSNLLSYKGGSFACSYKDNFILKELIAKDAKSILCILEALL